MFTNPNVQVLLGNLIIWSWLNVTLSSTGTQGTRTPDEAGLSSRSSRSDKACQVPGAESQRAAEPQSRRPALRPGVLQSSAPL